MSQPRFLIACDVAVGAGFGAADEDAVRQADNHLAAAEARNVGAAAEIVAALKKTLRERFGFEGAALCWNVMEAPVEHIEAVAELC